VALDEKATRYPRLDHPLVVAVSTEMAFGSQEVFELVLFGEHGTNLSPRQRREAGVDGFFFSKAGAKVGAVVAAFDIATWAIARSRPTIYLNPLNPIDNRLIRGLPFGVVSWDVAANARKVSATGSDMAKFFELGGNWPGINRLHD